MWAAGPPKPIKPSFKKIPANSFSRLALFGDVLTILLMHFLKRLASEGYYAIATGPEPNLLLPCLVPFDVAMG